MENTAAGLHIPKENMAQGGGLFTASANSHRSFSLGSKSSGGLVQPDYRKGRQNCPKRTEVGGFVFW